MLEICLLLNIRCVSAYAFAIDNFKRPKDEVDALMSLAEEKLLELCQHGCASLPGSLAKRLIRCPLRQELAAGVRRPPQHHRKHRAADPKRARGGLQGAGFDAKQRPVRRHPSLGRSRIAPSLS